MRPSVKLKLQQRTEFKNVMNAYDNEIRRLLFPLERFLGAFAKFRKATISFVMSLGLHVTTRLPLDGFS